MYDTISVRRQRLRIVAPVCRGKSSAAEKVHGLVFIVRSRESKDCNTALPVYKTQTKSDIALRPTIGK
jgi:hypothetical protein